MSLACGWRSARNARAWSAWFCEKGRCSHFWERSSGSVVLISWVVRCNRLCTASVRSTRVRSLVFRRCCCPQRCWRAGPRPGPPAASSRSRHCATNRTNRSYRTYMNSLINDLRFGLRMMVRNPVFSLIAVVTLALGIGANTAIFSVVDAVLLRPLPYPDADRLVFLWSTMNSQGVPQSGSALPDYPGWRDQNKSFDGRSEEHT